MNSKWKYLSHLWMRNAVFLTQVGTQQQAYFSVYS